MLSAVCSNCLIRGTEATSPLMRLKTSVPWKNDSAYFHKPTSRGTEQRKRLSLWSSKRRNTNLLFSRESFGYISGNGSGRSVGNKIVCFASRETGSMYTWPDNQKPRVCILGGGFGGLYTALRLESLEWPDDKKPQVLLVDQSENFVFKPMLYELLSGEVDAWEIAPSFKDLLANTSVKFVKDKVKILQPSDYLLEKGPERLKSGGTIHLESGIIIEYDWLVLALGAEAKLDLVPGASEYALPFSTLDDALKVDKMLTLLERRQFGNNFSPIHVAIVGCGYSGVELAATISERLQDKGIVKAVNASTTICPTAPPGNRETALRVLSSRNTQLFLGYFVRCIREFSSIDISEENSSSGEDVNKQSKGLQKFILELQPAEKGLESQNLEADLVLWTVGSKPMIPQSEPFQYMQVIPINGRGQVETDETLRVKGHHRIFAIGDSAAFMDSAGKILPSTAQVAFQQADFTGWNLWAAINNRPLLPFRFQNLGEMMTLGRNDAAISPSFIEGFTLDGPLGHAARKMAYLLRLPSDEHRVKVGISWLAKSAVESVASLQNTFSETFTGSQK